MTAHWLVTAPQMCDAIAFEPYDLAQAALRLNKEPVGDMYEQWLDATYKAHEIEQMAADTRDCRTVVGRLRDGFCEWLVRRYPPVEGEDYVIDGRTVATWEVDR